MKSLFILSGFKNKVVRIHPDIIFMPESSPHMTQLLLWNLLPGLWSHCPWSYSWVHLMVSSVGWNMLAHTVSVSNFSYGTKKNFKMRYLNKESCNKVICVLMMLRLHPGACKCSQGGLTAFSTLCNSTDFFWLWAEKTVTSPTIWKKR